jgi:hypothetical protein
MRNLRGSVLSWYLSGGVVGSVHAMVRVVGGWPMGFWGLWCPDVAEVVVVGRIDYAEVIVADDAGYCYVAKVVVDDEECGCVLVLSGCCI